MATRVPLVIDASLLHLKELPTTDNLNLSASAISSVGDINSSGVITATSFSGTFSGNTSGNAAGLTGSPTITVTDITGRHLNLTGVSTFAGALDVNSNVNISGFIDVDGQATLDDLNVSGVSTFAGAIDANGDIDVDGQTTLDDLNVSGVSTLGGAVDINNNVDISGFIDVDGQTTLDDLNISGVTTASHLTVLANTNLGNSTTDVVTITGSVDLNGDIDVDGDTQLDDLNVAGVATFSAAIDANSRVDINLDLDVNGKTDLDDLSVAGVSTFAAAINANSGVVGNLTGNATGLSGSPSIVVQDITAEMVSVAGTMQYEDVVNIDSIGIITARSGLRVTSGTIGLGAASPAKNLHIEGTAHTDGILIHAAGNHSTAIDMDSNRSSAAGGLAELNFKWNGTTVGQIGAFAGSDTTNKDDGHIHFGTASAGSIAERLRIVSDGRVLIGTSSGATAGSTNNALFTICGAVDSATNPPQMNLWRNASISSGQELGKINFCGESGTGVPGATISAEADAEWNTSGDASDHPGRLIFSTVPDGSSVATERMRIKSDGEVIIGGSDRPVAGQGFNSGSGWGGVLQIEKANPGAGNNAVPFLAITAFNAANQSFTGGISFNRSNHNTQGTQGAVNTNQQLGNIAFNGSDGTNFIQGAEIFAIPDQTFATNDGPASLVFGTVPDGTGTTAPVERLRIDSAGIIKCGTSGVLKAEINNAFSGHQFISQCDNNENGFEVYQKHGSSTTRNTFAAYANTGNSAAKELQFAVSGSGLVSIGTTSIYGGGGTAPAFYVRNTGGRQVKIHNTDAGTCALQLTNSTTGEGEDTGTMMFVQGSTGHYQVQNNHQGGDVIFRTRPSGGSVTDAVTITSAQELRCRSNVGYGSPYPGSTQSTTNAVSFGLHNSGSGGNRMRFVNNQCTQAEIETIARDVNTGSANDADLIFKTTQDASTATRLTISHNGTFSGSGTNDISDKRLKENIVTIANATDKIKALEGRTFNWRSSVDGVKVGLETGTQYGFISQEMENIIPEFVSDESGIRGFDKDGKFVGSATTCIATYAKSVKMSGVIPILVEALKETLTEIDILKGRIAALES